MSIVMKKLVTYKNVICKTYKLDKYQPFLTDSKATLHRKKILLCVWWYSRGVIYYEKLKANLTLIVKRYFNQL